MSDNNDRSARRNAENNVPEIEKIRELPREISIISSTANSIYNIIPKDWFEIHVLGDEGFDVGQSHIMLERIAGPAVGSFHLWRHQGYIYVRTLIEPGVDADQTNSPERFRHITDAVEAIARAISSQLQAWTLLLRRNQGRS